ncbi:MAG: ABC transporter permease [Pyrinomonadaceae bacterium]
MSTLLQDLRFGARMLMKNPGFALVAVTTLALGIGANTAIFSVVHAVLLKPLPFTSSERLVALGQTEPRNRTALSNFSFRNFADLREQNRSFERLAAYYDKNVTLTGQGESALLRSTVITSDLFPLLGAAPALGRAFLPEEDKAGGGGVGRPAMLSWDCWRQRFGGDTGVVGRAVTLDGESYTVVGVMPAQFAFPVEAQPTEVWLSTALDSEKTGDGSIMIARGYRAWRVIGRLKPGVTLEQAQAEAEVIGSSLASQYPDVNEEMGIRAMPLLESLVGSLRLILLLLFVTVGVVLLIACVNVANLLLERAVSRQREINIRLALGASRWRITRQLVTESLLLALAGGVAGTILAMWGTDLIISLSPQGIARITETRLDAGVLAFTAAVSVLTGVLFGLAPAFTVAGTSLSEALKDGGRSSSGGLLSGSARGLLVVAQVSMALVLLVGAGLLIKSLVRLQKVELGFDPRNILTLKVAKTSDPSRNTQQLSAFYQQVTERVRTLPGVVAASVVFQPPLSGEAATTGLAVEGDAEGSGDRLSVVIHTVGTDYFRTMGIPVMRGREFGAHDDLNSTPAIIINETLARRVFPGEDPIGKRIRPSWSPTGQYVMREIVGVVGDVRHRGLQADVQPEIFFAQAQVPMPTMTVVARTTGDARAIADAARREIQSLDKDAPVYRVLTVEELLSRSLASSRFNMTLLAAFAGVALLLTAVGLYGVVSFTVSQSTHEIGIRMALGAQTSDVLKLVLGQGMALAAVGVIVGLGASYGLTRLMSGLLFGVGATDRVTFGAVTVLLLAVAALACYIPARRATKVDPMEALRYE